MVTPAVAVAAMLALAPEGGVRRAVGGLGLGTAGFKAWPLAVGGPVAIHLIGLALLVATGLTALEAPQMTGSWGGAALRILAGLLAGTLFALCEEVGGAATCCRTCAASAWSPRC